MSQKKVETLSRSDEQNLVDATIEAIKLTKEGQHPDAAISKVAVDRGFNRNFIARMVEAFNVSRSLKHFKQASGDDKASVFDIADIDKILKTVFPEGVSTPAAVKLAAWVPPGTDFEEHRVFKLHEEPRASVPRAETKSHDGPPFDMLLKRAYKQLSIKEREAETSRHAMASSRIQFFDGVTKLANYFRTVPCEPFARVEAAALRFWGERAKPLMNMVYTMSKGSEFNVKRASKPGYFKYSDSAPYTMLQDVMTSADNYIKTATAHLKLSRAADSFRDELRLRERVFGKRSFIVPALTGAMAEKYMNTGLKARMQADEASAAAEKILPPEYQAESKAIRAQVMLNDFLGNDQVLRNADPSFVIKAYNDISALMPRAAQAPMIMRGLLRKAVEAGSSYDPYELVNLVGLETGLKKLETPGVSRDGAEGAS